MIWTHNIAHISHLRPSYSANIAQRVDWGVLCRLARQAQRNAAVLDKTLEQTVQREARKGATAQLRRRILEREESLDLSDPFEQHDRQYHPTVRKLAGLSPVYLDFAGRNLQQHLVDPTSVGDPPNLRPESDICSNKVKPPSMVVGT